VRGLPARILGEKLVLEEHVERQGRWITALEDQVDEMRRGEYEFPALLLKRKEQAACVPVAQAPKRAPNKPGVAKNKNHPDSHPNPACCYCRSRSLRLWHLGLCG